MFWALGLPAGDALVVSGSSLLTLGFDRPAVSGGEFLAFAEAAIGLALVALLVSYLPTIYGSFSRRELLVNLLEVRADSPPSPIVMITRMDRLSGLYVLHDLWVRWEQWFAELEETHTSLPVLVFYRSQQNNHSWVNASGAMMDAAALDPLVGRHRAGRPGRPDDPGGLPGPPPDRGLLRHRLRSRTRRRPRPRASIGRGSTRRSAVLEAAGVPLVKDRDQAWADFNGWRVNYDAVLRGLERLTMAPTPWWERPMQSAYVTDEPVVHEGVATAGRLAAKRARTRGTLPRS